MLLQGYADLELVGEGGLGRVYRARRVSTGGMVAIKELLEISAGSPTWHRARRELDALLRLKGHSHVINVEEVIDGPDGPCLVMEYAPDGSLFDRIQSAPLTAPELVLVGQHVCEALAASHAVAVIHRDIKPHNLLIGAFGQVKVCDFGIASLARDGETRTKTGALTMAYASPEELDGSDDIGPAADVYSFAATMLHLASGRRPSFQDRVDATTIDFANNDPALTSSITCLRRALAHKPEDRPSVAELSASFDEGAYLLGPRRIKALPPTPGRHVPQPVPLQPVARTGSASPTIARPTEYRPAAPPTIPFAPPTIVRPAYQPQQLPIPSKSRNGLLIAAAVALIASSAAVAVALTRDSGEATTTVDTTAITTTVTTAITTATATVTATTVQATTSTTSAPAQFDPSQELEALVTDDGPTASTLVGAWVAQLSGKYVGLEENGITYNITDIYYDHTFYRSVYEVILVDGGAFQFMWGNNGDKPMDGWFLTIVAERFDSKAAARQWCTDHGFVNGGCYARIFQPPSS